MDRDRKRTLLRDLDRFAATVPGAGFPIPFHIEHVGGLTKRLIALLRQRQNPRRASDAANLVSRLFDETVRRHDLMAKVECQRGCAYCCKNYLSASAPFVFALARHLRESGRISEDQLARIRESEAVTRGLTSDQRMAGRQPCALLVEESCLGYLGRPIACRSFASFSVQACRTSFEGGDNQIPLHGAMFHARAACDQAMFAAMRHLGHPIQSYELSHAVVVALTRPDAEEAWLAGEPVFADVVPDRTAAGIAGDFEGEILDALIGVANGKIPDLDALATAARAPTKHGSPGGTR